MKKQIVYMTLALFLLGVVFHAAASDPLPWANPWDVGMDYRYVNRAFTEAAAAIGEKAAPGAVGIVIKDGHIIARRALGNAQTNLIYRSPDNEKLQFIPMSQRMLESTIFDLASVTKMVACTTSLMILIEEGKIKLDDPVVKYIPSFGARAKDKVTIRHLMTHSSGLPAWAAFWVTCVNREEVYRSIDEDFALEYPPGENRIYSDLGFIKLGQIVETVTGQRLDHFTKERIFEPLGMDDTMYLPWLQRRLRVAPTEYDPLRDTRVERHCP